MQYTITLTQQELNLLRAGLGELPLKMSLDLFGKLMSEQDKQDKAKAVTIPSVTI